MIAIIGQEFDFAKRSSASRKYRMPSSSSPAKLVIELRAQEVEQLYDMLDPYPFRERDLDPDVDDFIVGWAREKRQRGAIEILVHLPMEETEDAAARQFPGALALHFSRRADAVTAEMAELFRNGRRFLAIGMLVLVLCVILSQYVTTWLGRTDVSRFISESALIVGWVANWRPIEIFLYDWVPLRRRRNLFRRLAAAEVLIRAGP
jgi:hypothetical protein